MTRQNSPEDRRRIASEPPETTHRCTIWLKTDGTIAAVTDLFLETTGFTREEFVGHDALTLLSRSAVEDAPVEDGGDDALAEAIQRLLDADTIAVETVETEIPTADGDTASFTLDLVSRPSDEEFRGSVGVHPTESEQEIRDRELWVKTHAMDDADIALCLSDPNRPDNPLIYVNKGFEEVTGYTASEAIGQNCRFLQGEETDPETVDQLREAVDEGEPASVELKNYRKDGTPFWNRVEVVPIRDESGDIVHFLGSQRDITERKQREQQLREQREQLLALDQLNRVIRGINSALVSMSTREEVEEIVCERLADSSSYAAAWIGEVNSARGTITPRASAGIDTASLSSETESLDATDGERASPAMRATRSQEVEVVTDVEDEPDSEWRSWALENGYRSVAAVPIGFQEFQYDVLTIYSSREHGFTGQERDAVAQLREIVGHAINAIERKEALLDNIVVQLEFVMRDPESPLFAATDGSDCTVTYERTIPLADDKAIQFIRVHGMGWEEVRTALTDDPSVDHARVVSEREDGCLVEIRSPETPITSKLAGYGGQVVEAVVEDGEFRVVVEVPHEIDLREIATAVQRAYPDAELVAQRSTTRSVQTLKQFQSALASRLTDKQQAALEAAFAAGYFTWPRESTGEEIAEGLGIAPATFHEHLRNGLSQLLGASLEGADRSD